MQENIILGQSKLFNGLSEKIKVGLYHSWAVKEGRGEFIITAHSENHTVMAIENEAKKMYGVQFHPESILTPIGMEVVNNFLEIV